MPVGDPFVHAECDKCGEVSDPIRLTSLVGSSWDMRNVTGTLKRMRWHVDGETTICEDCHNQDERVE